MMSEVKLRLAVRDLYRGDGGPLNDYNQGWNDGTDAAAEIFSAENERLWDALKSLVAHYVDLVDTGDAGVWDAETEPVVVNARAALGIEVSK